MELEQVLRERRTVRRFLQTPIADADLAHLIDMARLASCGRNAQRLRYTVVRTPDLVEKIFPHTAWAGSVAPRRNPVPGETAPTAFIVVTGPAADAQTPLLQADCGAAVQTIQLAAWERQIGCCWMGAIDREAISSLLKLPENLKVSCVVALGYPAEQPREVEVKNGNIKYYLDDNTLCVPKRSLEDVLIKINR